MNESLRAAFAVATLSLSLPALAVTAPAPAPAPPAAAPAPHTVPEQLQQLADLRDRGVITAAELETKKAQLLERM